MALRALVILWVVASEASSPTTEALTDAFGDALRSDGSAVIDVRAGPSNPGRSAGTATVLLRWTGKDKLKAHLRCYLPRSNRWVTRQVEFDADDPDAERGRALGFLLASIYFDEFTPPAASPRPPPPAPIDPPRAPLSPPYTLSESHAALSAAASVAGPGDITGLGAWLGFEYSPTTRIGVGVAVEGRLGSIPTAQATTRVVDLLLGADARLIGSLHGPWLGLRVAAGGVHLSAAHLSADDPSPDTQSRLLPFAEVGARVGYELGPLGEATATLCAQSPFSATEVYVHGRREATLPAIYPVARLGVRARL